MEQARAFFVCSIYGPLFAVHEPEKSRLFLNDGLRIKRLLQHNNSNIFQIYFLT